MTNRVVRWGSAGSSMAEPSHNDPEALGSNLDGFGHFLDTPIFPLNIDP